MKRSKNERTRSISLKLAQNYRIISVAYHEASHVICAILLYMQISEVLIDEGVRGVGGSTHYDMLYGDDKYNQLENKISNYLICSEVYMKYAGLAGEKIYFRDMSGSDKFPAILKFGTEPDMREAAELIKKYNLADPGNKRYLLKKKMFRYTTTLLKEYWEDVKIIAHALYEKRKLQGDEIKALLYKKSPNKKFWKKQFKTINDLFATLDNGQIMRIIDKT